jgi:hypothetical protein
MATVHPNAEKLISLAEEFFAEVADLSVHLSSLLLSLLLFATTRILQAAVHPYTRTAC